MHDPGKQLRHYVAKPYVEVAGKNNNLSLAASIHASKCYPGNIIGQPERVYKHAER